ncbi:glycoside hydrolase family 3 C-terminal domain-containing protein [Sphingomonas sp.]|uniref:beta-glucosidase family protein n=1 Tax=Sphingomonas sp. TaxID=28214 RepID=UPI0031CFD19B
MTFILLPATPGVAQRGEDPDRRAAQTERAMRPEERAVLTHGIMAVPIGGVVVPAEAVPGAGYIAGVPRLGVPALKETDASLGVAHAGGIRKEGATALPSALAMGATWNPGLVRQGGAMIAREARASGFNVLLAGGINLIRDPRGGRSFEYFGEDPLHTAMLGGAAVAGIQSERVISTVKHFALNAQETGRRYIDSRISEAAARESDLLAFQMAIEIGRPGAVMCGYNQVNGRHACDNPHLLNDILKRDWRYPGYVMSDWGTVRGIEQALAGLDQQSGDQLDSEMFFAAPLAKAAATDPRYATRLADMNRRILRSIYAVGLDRPGPASAPIDRAGHAAVAKAVANEAIVLLRNRGDILPLARTARRIAVIGGQADRGVLSGGGSSQVEGEGGAALHIPMGSGDDPFSNHLIQTYHRSVPLAALRRRAPDTRFVFRDGHHLTDAVAAAKGADVAIVFATQWMGEGLDVPDLSLPDGQDGLIAAVAAANPNTIVVLETGSAVKMPWADDVAGVIAAWYPGAQGAEAIASVLYGDVNPSGRLPITFPRDADQLPHPELAGSATVDPTFLGQPVANETLSVDYDVEGADIGYRWFARTGKAPLFPFGYGLSYTRFRYGPLTIGRGGNGDLTARFTITNVGSRPGADVGQVYLNAGAGRSTRRLVGFEKVMLAPGETRTVSVQIDPRLLARWQDGGWSIDKGRYDFFVGRSAEDRDTVASVTLAGRHWHD